MWSQPQACCTIRYVGLVEIWLRSPAIPNAFSELVTCGCGRGSQMQVPKSRGGGLTPSPSEAIFTSHIVNIETYEHKCMK